MSSKEKTIGMKEGGKPTLVPKLRFPEFRAAEGWQLITLGSVCEILNNRRRPISSSERTPGPYPYYGASGIVDYVADFIFDERLLLVGEDGAKWSAFEKTAFIATGRYWVNNHAHVLKPCGLSDTLLAQYLTLLDLSPFVTGAAPPKLTLGKLKSIPIPLPSKPVEQRKIADCLTSLDEAIAAQARKVDALTKHKKGLMQQLFPREGETQPRLRFPEFQNAGAWKPRPLGSVCSSFSGGTPSTSKPEYYGGDIPFIRSAEIARDKTELFLTREGLANSAAKLVARGDVLVALYGANSGDVALATLGGAINQAILCLKSKESNPFIYQFLSFKKDWIVATYLQGGQGNLSGEIVKSIAVGFPAPEEQKRIASCLSSLDALLTTEAQKLEAIKRHKHGLMQQLFPSPVEVEG